MYALKVYHDNEPAFGFGDGSKNFPADFTPVAMVRGTENEAAYMLTQNVHCGWTNDPKTYLTSVVPLVARARSTSVGDVIVNELTGEKVVVAPFGFKKLDSDTVPADLH